jgi:ribonuclease HI
MKPHNYTTTQPHNHTTSQPHHETYGASPQKTFSTSRVTGLQPAFEWRLLTLRCPSTHLRLKRRGQDVVVQLYTFPPIHPISKVMERAKRRVNRKGTQHKFPLAETIKSMALRELESLEAIDPTPLEPWSQSNLDGIRIEQDRDRALDAVAEMMDNGENVIFTDASAENSNLGAAVVMPYPSGPVSTWQIGIGSESHWTVHAAELIAINKAIEIVGEQLVDDVHERNDHRRRVTVISDSQSANTSERKSTQQIWPGDCAPIINRTKAIRERQMKIRLQWIPSHSGNAGNEIADHLAKQAVTGEEHHDFRHLVSTYKRTAHKKILKELQQEWASTPKGKHLKRIDDGPLSKRNLHVYGTLTRHQSYLLAQLRTGHSWLATHARRQKFSDDGRCECGATETVVHVLVECPRLREARRQMRNKVGDALNSIATMLGGRPRNGQGRVDNCGIKREVLNAVLEFAEASQRFKSRVPATSPKEQHRPQRG